MVFLNVEAHPGLNKTFFFCAETFCALKPELCLCIRSIKRKKFDDELVESSLVKSSSRVKGTPVIEPVRCSGSEPSSTEKKKVRN